ncbi:hypothetical protein ACLOJK_017233 [Asimina triloba]
MAESYIHQKMTCTQEKAIFPLESGTFCHSPLKDGTHVTEMLHRKMAAANGYSLPMSTHMTTTKFEIKKFGRKICFGYRLTKAFLRRTDQDEELHTPMKSHLPATDYPFSTLINF